MTTSSTGTAPSFDNSYARLPAEFYEHRPPTPVDQPALIRLNEPLADSLGLDSHWLGSDEGVSTLAGNHVPDGAEPIAMAYAGHQFGHWVPQLGDGRAILLGELIDNAGIRQDVQLKGAGRTAWSRGGDGRNWIGPVLREYLVSEAMAALGVRTTRALAALSTGEPVRRETTQPGAVLVRVAESHIRVGTFQYFTARQNEAAVQALVDHVIDRHYPAAGDAEIPALALFESVVEAQATLVAHWMSLGFIHGVMNTDNCSVAGLTIDYGPCAFLDTYEPMKVFSSIDVGGRYAYARQPQMAQWNLANLAQCLLRLIDPDTETAVAKAQAVLDTFGDRFSRARNRRFAAKLGIQSPEETDSALINEFLERLAEHQLDFTVSFRELALDPESLRETIASPAFDDWFTRWQTRLQQDGGSPEDAMQAMRDVNPAIIPRNHQIERVIRAAIDETDFSPFHTLADALNEPFSTAHDGGVYAVPPASDERVAQTFCGT